MNWLAHVFLSEPDVECRLGNLMADIVKGKSLDGMPERFLQGVRQHQAVDSFTDFNPLVHQSLARIRGEYRHVKGILIDVFYDHFLAIDWEQYSSESLDAFTTTMYADFRCKKMLLPEQAMTILNQMIDEDWLGSYRHLEGIEAALSRVSVRLSERTGRKFSLEKAVDEMLTNFEGLKADFTLFSRCSSHMFVKSLISNQRPLDAVDLRGHRESRSV